MRSQPLAALSTALIAVLTLSLTTRPALAADEDLPTGPVKLTSAGPLAFGEDGILFAADPRAGAIYALHTADNARGPLDRKTSLPGVSDKIAAMLGIPADQLVIADMAVNPISGNIYFAVAAGRAPDSPVALLRLTTEGKLENFSLDNIRHASAALPNPAPDAEGRRGNPRMQSVTDLLVHDGVLYIAGLSNEEFASKLHAVQYPFDSLSRGTSIEIYHANHGQLETRSPIRTFALYPINNEPHLLAGYTCTPLVKIPIRQLGPEHKIVGDTIAELGNRNTPLDMFPYSRDGKDYLLIANTARGVMKVSLDNVAAIQPLTGRVDGTAGTPYDTLADFQGVTQIDKLDDTHAVVLAEDNGITDLYTIELP